MFSPSPDRILDPPQMIDGDTIGNTMSFLETPKDHALD